MKKKSLWGKSVKWPQLLEHLVAWVWEKRVESSAISTLALRLKARSLAKEVDIGDFTASPSWTYRFMVHHNCRFDAAHTTVGEFCWFWERPISRWMFWKSP